MAKFDANLLKPPRADRMVLEEPRGRGLFWLLFSFRGRLSRGGYWLGSLLLAILYAALLGLGLYSGLGTEWTMQLDVDDARHSYDVASQLGGPLFPILFCVAGVCQLALLVKRWHDRGRSALLLLAIFLPILGWFWISIEVLFLRGTEGPNQFGDDPAAR